MTGDCAAIWKEPGARILVADDGDVVRALFKEMLEEEGHTVITAGNSATDISACLNSFLPAVRSR